MQKILRKARQRVKVILIPGNHFEVLREYVGSSFGDITIARNYIHVAADGKRYILLHGDEYDQVTHYHRWVSVFGDVSYRVLVHVNRVLSLVRRKLGVSGHWSLADYAKRIDGITYINCGDWVDNCTASVEHYDGRMEMVRWVNPAAFAVPPAAAIAEVTLP